MIVDSSGTVIAHPDLMKCMRRADSDIVFATMASFSDQVVRDAAAERAKQGRDRIIFKSGRPAAEYAASFTAFPPGFGKKWEMLTITPTDDFLSELRTDYRRLLLIIAAAVVLELAAIVVLSKKLVRQEAA